METNQLQDVPKYGQKVAGQYMALEREARRYNPEGKILHIVPKFHMFQHICEAPYPPKDYCIGAIAMKLWRDLGKPLCQKGRCQ